MRYVIPLILTTLFWLNCTDAPNSDLTPMMMSRPPIIAPDYTNTVLPPNIAPTNFRITENGSAFAVTIAGENGDQFTILSQDPAISIPISKWRKMLQANRGAFISITISVKNKKNEWHQYQPIVNKIAEQNIESHLVYRLIKPLYVYWDQMGIYQRDLTSFQEKPIFLNRATDDNCINCHSFHNHNPERFLFHMRAASVGTAMMLAFDGKTYKIDTSTEFNRATAYRAWHPNGSLIAFSSNTVNQFFHAFGENRDVYDKASDLVVYDLKTNTISTSPAISTVDRMETYPEWSADGTQLYFCVTDGLDAYDEFGEHPYSKIKYDLMRIAYDASSNTWGELEPVLLASTFGQSITHPKVSPDGKFVLFTMSGYGNFSIYKPDADLYLLDTDTKEFRPLDILNSDKSESYHAWSQDGRWVVFSSKRQDGLTARPFFSYVEKNGTFAKPFVLPQKDPEFYDTFLKTYNIPEFVNGPVRLSPQKLARRAWDRKSQLKAKLDTEIESRQEEAEDPMWKPVQKIKK